MAYSLPKIDQRGHQDVANEIRSLIVEYCDEYSNVAEIEADKQVDALVKIFSNMTEHVITALNQAPDKHFTTFLNLIGVTPTPPRMAKAPIIFKLKEDWDKEAFIPAGTKISAQPDNQEELIFETVNDLTVIRPKIIRVVSVEPEDDQWGDYDFLLSEEATGREATLFRGDTKVLHRLYMSHDEIIGMNDTDLTINLKLSNLEKFLKFNNELKRMKDSKVLSDEVIKDKDFKIQWFHFDEEGNPVALTEEHNLLDELFSNDKKQKVNTDYELLVTTNVEDDVLNLELTFKKLKGIIPKEISGYSNGEFNTWKGNWIFAELKSPITNAALVDTGNPVADAAVLTSKDENPVINAIVVPTVEDIKLNLSASFHALAPEAALYNYAIIDLSKDFYPFGERPTFNDTFYIASKHVFSKKDAIITLDFGLTKPGITENIKIAIEYYNGNSWVELDYLRNSSLGESSEIKNGIIGDGTKAFTVKGRNTVSFRCPDIKACEISGKENYWVRFRIIEGDYGKDNAFDYSKMECISGSPKPPAIKKFEIAYTATDGTSGKGAADAAYFNAILRDLNKDFYPFGEKPTFNDTFYFASRAALSKKNSKIDLNFELSSIGETEDIILAIEYFDGNVWAEFDKIVKSKDTITTKKITDNTKALTVKSQTMSFTCPDIKEYEIDGKKNYWLRIRIIGGDYGKDKYYDYTKIEYLPANYQPPIIKNLEISFVKNLSEPENPTSVISENNFVMTDRTGVLNEGKAFKLFTGSPDINPAIYLAFDRDIGNLPLNLLFPLNGEQLGNDPVVGWEYWNGSRWLTLTMNDATRDFTRREIQVLNIPIDIKKYPFYGVEAYWIRARLEKGSYEVYPKIAAIYSNAVWAENSNTLKGEILGSSNGEPSQVFQFTRTPVLSGQKLMVHETIGKNDWITWEEVQTFSLSEADSRHYMLDAESGQLTFGDGLNGLIPPAGTDNIKCDYQYGGGKRGNINSNTITKLWTEIPGIEAANNPVASDGGFDQEEVDEAKVRGPYTLKNRNRGVTGEDIEWLVREAAPQIAIVKCFPTMDRNLDFKPGEAIVIVVPENSELKPMPSQELLGEIDKYLSKRISTVLNSDNKVHLNVIGPDYIRIGIEAEVVYTTPESGKIIEGRIIENLKQFLDPINGGQDRTGWKLGKNMYVSEISSEIRNTAGVNFVKNINVKSSVQCYTLNLEIEKTGPYKPSITYPSYSSIRSKDNKMMFILAQKLQAEKGVKSILAKGFREGQKVTLKHKAVGKTDLRILNVDGDVLECEVYDEDPMKFEFPMGSDIEAIDIYGTNTYIIRSYILNNVKKDQNTFLVKIAVLEAGDTVYLSRNFEYTNTTPLKIREVRSEDIFLEEDELVYSGVHLINKKPELKFTYLMNNDTNIIHDLTYTKDQCLLKEIQKEDRVYYEKLTDATKDARVTKCKFCFHEEE